MRRVSTYRPVQFRGATSLEAEDLMKNTEFHVDSGQVLELANQSGCTAYDCEFIAVAKTLGAKLVTADKQVLRAFPGIAVPL
jgi:predicted nucleic acid-binding protein